MIKSLYDIKKLKSKNSVLKSVFINLDDHTVGIEAYDDYFIIKANSDPEALHNFINQALFKYMKQSKNYLLDVYDYSTFDNFRHYILNYRDMQSGIIY